MPLTSLQLAGAWSGVVSVGCRFAGDTLGGENIAKYVSLAFKCGPWRKDLVHWVADVSPEFYRRFEGKNIYVCLMRCGTRLSTAEDDCLRSIGPLNVRRR